MVIDGGTGAVLQASNSNVRCHPASLTKVMTLYLLFERLDVGELHLDDLLEVSEHASEQAPNKLDLKPGQTTTVEDAIKGKSRSQPTMLLYLWLKGLATVR
jgi:D-alanyl-D-alanine carboxypeptidase